MRVIREIRLFLLAILLPAVIVAAGGVRLLVYMWESMWAEERRELEVRAYFIAGEIEDRIHDKEGDHHPHLHEGHPPRHPDDHLTSKKRMVIAAACEDVLKERSGLEGDVAFEVIDRHGERIFATSGWPDSPSVVGESHLGPPAGNGTLSVARVDGSAMRNRAVAIAASGAVIVLLLVAALVSGGVLLVRTLRRERRESRMKTDFIDNVSHELNTPLAGIRLTAELLAEGRIPDGERRQGALKSILTESDRLSRMVSELLDFSRLEKGTRRYSIETFDLAEFASGPAEAQGVDSISRGRAHIAVKGEGALVSADKDAIRQIGINLVGNAVKYSEGPIDIEVEGNEIRFMDRGSGIPPECTERIFERFYRVDDSLTRREGGSGLGLPIARALARGMGGDVTYSPRPGGGSVFTLTLAPAEKRKEGTGS
ncbi:MAG: HAMP domain-containing histidine kinase [Lentisphaerae bacterium]|nr:HAMP domain-containing histidine kinase [Lentisphaerota bacterium]